MSGLKRLYSNSAVYAMGSIAAKAIGFVMIPVYTRCLTPADYGTVELMYRATDVISLIAAMGMGAAVMRFYFDYKSQKDQNEVVSSGLLAMLAAGLVAAALASLFREQFSVMLFGHAKNALLVQLAVIYMLLDLAIIVPLSYIQAEQKPLLYTGIGFGKLLCGLAMNIWLIVYMRMGVMGVAWSATASSALAAAVVLPVILRRTGLCFSTAKAGEMFRFGLPLVPCQLAMFVLSFADRFILEHYSGVAEVGIYSLGYKFGMLLSLLVSEPFLTAWVPYALSIADTDTYKKAYPDTLRHFSVAAVAFALVMSLFARDVIRLMAAPSFIAAYTVVPVIALGHLLRSLAFQLEIGIIISKRTVFRTFTVGTSALADLGLCFLLIPSFGALGAAWAAAISFGLLAALSYAASSRLLPVPYDFRQLAGTLALGIAIYAAGAMVRLESYAASIALNTLLLLCFPACLFASGLWRRGEAKSIKNMIAQIKRSAA